MKYINIVLDIDLTLVEFHNNVIAGHEIIYVHEQPYYLIHGCREFMHLVTDLTNENIIFFSNGNFERNNEFAVQFLSNIFSGAKLGRVMNRVKVFSRPDKQMIIKDLNYVVPKKDLSKTILIDDDPINIAAGQEINFFHVHTSSMFMTHTFVVLNKLFYAAGLISMAFTAYQKKDNFVNILKNLRNKMDIYTVDVYYEGLRVLSQFNPEIKFKE